MQERNHDFKFYASYQLASDVRESITEKYRDSVIDLADGDQLIKPCKVTLLHAYIDLVVMDSFEVHLNDAAYDDYCGSEVIDACKNYGIEILTVKAYSKKAGLDIFHYNYDYLRDVAEQKLRPVICTEVFNLLFSDRVALLEFNKLAAEEIKQLKVKDEPKLLVRDGVLKRCRYWPKWLHRALFCREKGACAICRTDLSSVLHTTGKLAIDHMVPLALGGTNDTCNLQLLCEKCNLEKSGDKIITTNLHPTFW